MLRSSFGGLAGFRCSWDRVFWREHGSKRSTCIFFEIGSIIVCHPFFCVQMSRYSSDNLIIWMPHSEWLFNIYLLVPRPSTYAHHASPFSVKFLIPDSIFRAVIKWQPFCLRNGQFCFCSSLVRHSDDPGNRLCRHGAESAVGLRSTSRKLIPKVSNQDWDQKSAFFRN